MREKCYSCFRPEKNCLCSNILLFNTKIKFVILIHPKEAKKERLGTGRIVHQALINSELIMGVDFTLDKQVNKYLNLDKYRPLLMYPGEESHKVHELKEEPSKKDKETVIFILDRTWPFAKKMMRKSLNLHSIPRISFNIKKKSNFRIKQQPHELCLSTLEAVVQFLNECEEFGVENLDTKHHQLLDAFSELVEFQEKCALEPEIKSYRKSTYKSAEERTPSKKWQQYGIFYKG